jgi:competence ComEA-like helix-hairpin-helix protein
MFRRYVAAAFRPANVFLVVLLGVALQGFASQEKKEPLPEPLDLNTATVEQLDKLPGIGPTTAKAIVRFREKSGPFRRVEDLLAIRGITKKKLEKIRPLVTVKEVPKGNEERKQGSKEVRKSRSLVRRGGLGMT